MIGTMITYIYTISQNINYMTDFSSFFFQVDKHVENTRIHN